MLRGSAAAGALTLTCLVAGPGARDALAASDADGAAAPSGGFGPWLRLTPDGRIAAVSPITEIGQGIDTLVATAVAEELSLSPAAISVVAAPVDPVHRNPFFDSQVTGGSTGAKVVLGALQFAAAGLREMLLAAAAARWDCAQSACTIADGRIRNAVTGAALSYGALAAEAARLPVPQDVRPKRPGDWVLLGRPQKRIDSAAKLRGQLVYGIDFALPGMLLGAVLNAPSPGARLRNVDPAPALAIAGTARVVELPAAVVVLAESFWTAGRAAEALKPDWDEIAAAAALDDDLVSARLAAGLQAPGLPVAARGDAAAADAAVRDRLSLSFEVPLLAHAAMEPPNATASVTPDRVDIWAGTQAQEAARDAVAAALGRAPASVHVHTLPAGGSFGRSLDVAPVIQAALAAAAAGRPVKLIWSRAQDLRHDLYRPAAACRIEIGLDAEGLPVRWLQALAVPDMRQATADFQRNQPPAATPDPSAVEGAAPLPYAVGRHELTWSDVDIGMPTGWWRSVGHSFNAWFMEQAIDEIAHHAGRDPVGLRRLLLRDSPRHLAVLDAVQGMWAAPPAAGRFRGTALHESFGSVVAQSLEISLADGRPVLHHLNCAVDCGIALDPDSVVAQVQGGALFGLTAALHGRIRVRRGQVQDSNFDSYRLLAAREAPSVDVHVLPAGAAALAGGPDAIGGVGECGVPPAAPALCNAMLAATGMAVRRLPLLAT